VKSDFIVLAFGAWYKPYFAIHSGASLVSNMELNAKELSSAAIKMREYIALTNKKAKVFWRLHPHGKINVLCLNNDYF
jgi:hypothetical protein